MDYTNYTLRLCREEDFTNSSIMNYYYLTKAVSKSIYCIDNKEDDPVLTRNTDQQSLKKDVDFVYYRLIVNRCNQYE